MRKGKRKERVKGKRIERERKYRQQVKVMERSKKVQRKERQRREKHQRKESKKVNPKEMEKVKKVDRKGKKMRYKCIEMDRKTQKERVGREQY